MLTAERSLPLKALNQNFNMNITDYATINFYKLAEAIDILGGIDIDITEDERLELNNIGDDDNPNFQYVEKFGYGAPDGRAGVRVFAYQKARFG